jgi:DNA-binding NarL/FixJ family response regulator
MAKIFLVDDHPVVRQNYTLLIQREPSMEVCGEAATGLEAIERIRQVSPDVVVLDVSLSGAMDGLELLKQLQAWRPELSVLVVSGHDELLYAERILRMGARGYVMKGDALLFLQALHQVVNGETYVSTQMRKTRD